MTQIASRRFEPGTTGWSIDDLNDPQVLRAWSEGRFEIVEGVLTTMPPQGLHTVGPLGRLRRSIERHLDATAQGGEMITEVDVELRHNRIVRPDLMFLTPDQLRRQQIIEDERGITAEDYCPIFVAPTLIVESVSLTHEDHDWITKRAWYAEAGIAHYWLLTGHEKRLDCLELKGNEYVQIVSGRDEEVLSLPVFLGLKLPLASLWAAKQ
ncbi:MAG TPA: Uma2 family endonuclease [Humisphaera sp.]|jgi:Uma2 family endonuclease|nr:Uma2 family endonuclease [Humisphaera sp.]